MSKITLYWYWTTNPQKVRWALEEAKLPYELKKIDLARRGHHDADFKKINPRSKVPVAIIDGVKIIESSAILLTLTQRYGILWPKEPNLIAKGYELLFSESSSFSTTAGTFYYQLMITPRLGRSPDLNKLRSAKRRLTPLLDELEELLSDGRPFLLRELSIVDCAYGVWLPHINLSLHPMIAAWRTRLMERPAWRRAELRNNLTKIPSLDVDSIER